ncbi:MAG TPA: DNA ligase D, partial [Myxococcota bacterium]|nr:DNA ligase D [Myxococcota bacterium]
MIVWDRGTWKAIGDPHEGLEEGKLDFELFGEKLRGRWHFVRLRPRPQERGRTSWLLIKGRDAAARPATAGAVVSTEPQSVLTGRVLEEVARDADRVWSSRTGERGGPRVAAPGDPSALAGAARAPLPRRAEPQLATLVKEAPDGPEWLHEIKLDGYRLLGTVQKGSARLVSRNGHDWSDRFPDLVAALRALPAREAIVDGEAVVFDAKGRSQFQALQAALASGRARNGIQLVLFDCLHLDGWDVRGAPLSARKQLLRALLARSSGGALHFSDHVVGRGPDVHAEACASGVEGIVSKRVDAPYRAGRTRDWRKVKCHKRQEFVIVGWSEPAGTRVGLGALLLGAHDAEGRLRYCGKVGTGFADATLSSLRARLESLAQPRSAVVDPPRARGLHWVRPELVAEVSFTEWTRDGRVRHPVFQGLREDKPARDVRIETEERSDGRRTRDSAEAPPDGADAAPADATSAGETSTEKSARGGAGRRAGRGGRTARGSAEPASLAGVRLSHPDRVYYPDLGITKRELAEYYETVSERALPGLARRPLTLLRCPEGIEGEVFYQKHANASVPAAVQRVRVRGDRQPYAMVTDLASLISLVQIGVLELHVWGARADKLDRPDIVVFDLDPDAAVPWSRVVETARALRAYLDDLGVVAFPRVTGGKGVHLVVPIERRSTWDAVRGFSRGVALELVRLAPKLFTANMSKAGRAGKIYIDWVRNTVEATAIASYSPRARPGAPVALPLSWDELESLDGPLRESIRQAP